MGHGAKQSEYLDWKASLLGNIPPLARTSNGKGAVFADFTPLAELHELRSAVYLGRRKESSSPRDYLKALTPLGVGPSGTWTTVRSPSVPRGCSSVLRGGSGRIEIYVEAMSDGSQERLT